MKGIRPVKETGCWFVGGDDLTAALTSHSSSCHHHLHHIHGDILVPAKPMSTWKVAVKTERGGGWQRQRQKQRQRETDTTQSKPTRRPKLLS